MGWVILALLLLWSWRAKAENEAEITNLLYSSNGQDWLPLQGAVIESSYITVGVQWKSITASMGVTIVLSVDGETQEEVLGVDPGDTGKVDFSMNLGDGSYTAEVTLKETASGKVLDSRSASFTVATTPPPPPPPPGYRCECRMDPFTPYDEEGFINETTFRAGSIQNLNFWYSQSSLQDGSPIAVRLSKIYYGPMGLWDTGEQPVWWPVELTPYGAGKISVPVRAQNEAGTFKSYVVVQILDGDNVVCQYRDDGPDITII